MMQRPLILFILSLVSLAPSSSIAQMTFLSRHSLQIPDIEWHVLTAPHVRVFHLPPTAELTRKASLFAEEAYGEFEARLRFHPEEGLAFAVTACHPYPPNTNALGERTPLGIATVAGFPQDRSVLRFDGSLPRLRLAVRSEIARAFIKDRIDRVLSAHRSWIWPSPPDWFVNGLAGYYAGAHDIRTTMLLRDAVLNEQLVPLRSLGGVEDPLLRTALEVSAVDFLRQLVGEEGLLHIVDSTWTSWSFQTLLRQKTGKDDEELSADWHYALQKRFFPSLRTADLPSGLAQTLASGGANCTPVVFERDTLPLLLFQSTRSGRSGIYVRHLQNRDPKDLGTLLFECEISDRITSLHPWQSRMSISPGGLLAFPGTTGMIEAIQIYDLHGGELRQPIRMPQFTQIGSVSWSPDGRRLAFSAMDSSGRNDLYVLDVVTDSLRALTDDFCDDRDPAWSPDGTAIAFSSDRASGDASRSEHLFLYSVSEGTIARLTDGDQSDGSPAWSPDGKVIVFTSDRGSVQNLYALRVADSVGPGKTGTTIRRITDLALPVFTPAWTAEGDILFSTYERGSFLIGRLRESAPRGDSVAASAHPMGTESEPVPEEPTGEEAAARFPSAGCNTRFAQASLATTPLLGTTGGVLFAASRPLGYERFTVQVLGGPSASIDPLANAGIALSRTLHGKDCSTTYGLYYFTGRQYTGVASQDSYAERLLGAYGALGIPLGTFQRVELLASTAYTRNLGEIPTGRGKYLLASVSAGYVLDNSLWEGAGPIDGRNLRFSCSYTADIAYRALKYLSLTVDLRDYYRLGLHSALASRFFLFYNNGNNSRRFAIGGSWDLRGYAQGALRGEKMWFLSEELRFPFFDFLGVQSSLGGVVLWQVRGALTCDIGGVWDRDYLSSLGSFGFGLRASLGQVVTIRWDLGKRIENNFSSLQHGLYSVLFFGWDF